MKGEKGFTLVEAVIALALINLIIIGSLFGLGNASKALVTTDSLQTARTLAEAQLEYIKSLPYSGSYTAAAVPPEFVGYTVDINSVALMASNIEDITITVKQNGQVVTSLEGYKAQ